MWEAKLLLFAYAKEFVQWYSVRSVSSVVYYNYIPSGLPFRNMASPKL